MGNQRSSPSSSAPPPATAPVAPNDTTTNDVGKHPDCPILSAALRVSEANHEGFSSSSAATAFSELLNATDEEKHATLQSTSALESLLSVLSGNLLDEEMRVPRPKRSSPSLEVRSFALRYVSLVVHDASDPAAFATLAAHRFAVDDLLAVACDECHASLADVLCSCALLLQIPAKLVAQAVRRRALVDLFRDSASSRCREEDAFELPPPLAGPIDRLQSAHDWVLDTDKAHVAEELRALVKSPAFLAVWRRPHHPDRHGDSASRSDYDEATFTPYLCYGTIASEAFCAWTRYLTRAAMCAWACTPVCFPEGMRTYTNTKQRANLVAIVKAESSARALQAAASVASKMNDAKAQVKLAEEVKTLNRRAGALVHGVSDEMFALMEAKHVFEQTRAFSSTASIAVPGIELAHVFQAGRNAWTCFAFQSIYGGVDADCTDAVLGYSLLYPLTDNFLDDDSISLSDKLRFQERFDRRLRGVHTPGSERDTPAHDDGKCAFAMVDKIETQWPRISDGTNGAVYSSLAAINDAQTWSLWQQSGGAERGGAVDARSEAFAQMLEKSFYKGGTSVLADIYIVDGPHVPPHSGAFAFALGVLLQLVDDLQDTLEDIACEQHTIFTVAHAAATGTVDGAGGADEVSSIGDRGALRLFHFTDHVVRNAPSKTVDNMLQQLMMKMTANMVLKAIARCPEIFSEKFMVERGRFGPLPSERMHKLRGMRTLHKLSLENAI